MDSSGTLSREELKAALRSPDLRQILHAADIGKGEVEAMIDAIQSGGEVKYDDLVALLHQIESANLRKLMVVSHVTMAREFAHHSSRQESHYEVLTRMEASNSESLDKLRDRFDRLEIYLTGQRLPVPCSSDLEGPPETMAKPFSSCCGRTPLLESIASEVNGTPSTIATSDADLQLFYDSVDKVEKLTSELIECARLKIEQQGRAVEKQDQSVQKQSLKAQLSERLNLCGLVADLDNIKSDLGKLRQATEHQYETILQNLRSSLFDKSVLLAAQHTLLNHVCKIDGNQLICEATG